MGLILKFKNTMKKLQIKIFAAIIVAVLAGAAIVGWLVAYKPYMSYRTSMSDKSDTTDKTGPQPAPLAARYVNSQYGFSFSYPEGFNISDFDDGGGKIILVQSNGSDTTYKTDTTDESYGGFQIFIAGFDEPGPITKERILKDIPDMVIINEKEILVGGEKALSFISQDELGGEMREIWVVHPVRSRSPEATADPLADRTSNGASGGYLYQIMGYRNFEKELLEIMKTWRF